MTIQDYCDRQNINQGELAKLLGISHGYLSRIKHRAILPRQDIIDKLLSLGIDFDYEVIDLRNRMKLDYTRDLEAKIKKLKRENKRLKAFINKRLGLALKCITQGHYIID